MSIRTDLFKYPERALVSTMIVTSNHESSDEADSEDRFMTVAETCRFLSVSQPTLFRWRKSGIGPPYYEDSERLRSNGSPTIMYRRSELIAYMNRGRVDPRAARMTTNTDKDNDK
jgi:predicted DNA-binding transcriptional regulator AlpA